MEEVQDPMGDGNGKFPRSCDWSRQFGQIYKTILFGEAMSELMYLVRSDKRGAHNLLKPEYSIQFQGEGYNDMSEYIKVKMRLSLCVDQILTQVLVYNSLY